jgi:hypothetical protein
MLKRACGCVCEFQHYAVDRYRAQRQAKFERTRCEACVAKLVEQQRLAATLPKKGEAFKALPPDTRVVMNRKADGTWAGTLEGEGTAVEGTADGPQALVVVLARLWLGAREKAGKPAAG